MKYNIYKCKRYNFPCTSKGGAFENKFSSMGKGKLDSISPKIK